MKMGRNIILITILLILIVGCSGIVTGKGYADFEPEQKQFYWSCIKEDCTDFLKAKQYKEWRSCVYSCIKQAEEVKPIPEDETFCEDFDGGLDYKNFGTVTDNKNPDGKDDYCYTFPNGKVYLFEGKCVNNKYSRAQKNCKEFGETYSCQEGACVNSVCDIQNVDNGLVAEFPDCEISCNEGYALEDNVCVELVCDTIGIDNGVVSAYPDCEVSCNDGYDLTEGVCVSNNHAPVLDAIGNQEINVGEELTIELSATDEDGDELSYYTGTMPEGAEIDENIFTWTPTEDQVGENELMFIVSDGKADDSEVIVVDVVFKTWSSDPNTNLLILTKSKPFRPQSIPDGEGGMIFVWASGSGSLGDNDVYAQRINSEGVSLWGPGGIPIAIEKNQQTNPELVSDTQGGAIIIWEDDRDEGNPFGNYERLFAQRVDSDGNIMWAENGIALSTLEEDAEAYAEMNSWGTMEVPNVIPDGVGGAIVSWRYVKKENQIYAQRVNSEGEVLWGEEGKQICPSCTGSSMTLTTDGEEGAIIIWSNKIQRVNSEGEPMWGDNPISLASPENKQGNRRIINDGLGNVIVISRSLGDGVPGIYAQKINLEGIVQWEEESVLISKKYGGDIKTIIDDLGNIIVTWHSHLNNPLNYNHIYAQKIKPLGETLWGEDGVVVSNSEANSYRPFIVSDGSGGNIISWWDTRTGLISGEDLYAQRIDSDGNRLWGDEDVAISVAPAGQWFQTMVPSEGGAIIVWEDHRNYKALKRFDLYGQRILSDGTLG
jgi:hypothetical protein